MVTKPPAKPDYLVLPNDDALQEVVTGHPSAKAENLQTPVPLTQSSSTLNSSSSTLSDPDDTKPQQPTSVRTPNITQEEHDLIIVNLHSTELLMSIGDVDDDQEVRRLLDKGASPNATCQASRAAVVHLAALHGNTQVLRALHEHGADLSRLDELGRSCLHFAVWSDHAAAARFLLEKNPGLLKLRAGENSSKLQTPPVEMSVYDVQDRETKLPLMEAGSTALHLASQRVSTESVQLLLSLGADANSMDDSGLTPLDVAGENYSIKLKEAHGFPAERYQTLVELLVTAGARPTTSKKCVYRQTPLHVATELQSTEAIRLLAKAGYLLHMRNSIKTNPMHYAVRERLPESLKTLLEVYGVNDVRERDGKGDNPLHIAVEWEWTAGVVILLTAGVDVLTKNSKGKTIVHLATASKKMALLKELLKHPAIKKIVNEPDNLEMTPLYHAIVNRNAPCVSLLLEANANFKKPDVRYGNVLHCAAAMRQPDILKTLFNHDKRAMKVMKEEQYLGEKYGVKGTPLHISAYQGSGKCVKFLLKRKCNLHALIVYDGKMDYTALHLASLQGHHEVVEVILQVEAARKMELLKTQEVENKKKGKKTNGSTKKQNGVKAHHSLMDFAAQGGWMPLHLACVKRQVECVRLLAKAGANLSAVCTEDGVKRTALDLFIHCVPFSVDLLREILDYSIAMKGGQIAVDYQILLPREVDEHKMSVLDDLLDTGDQLGQRNLFTHPLIESFLWLQWNTLSTFYYMLILIYTVFVLTFSFMTVAMFYYADIEEDVPSWLSIPVCQVIVTLCLVFLTLHEISYFTHWSRKYLKLFESWIKIILIVLSFLVTFLPDVPRECATIAIVFSWLEFMYMFSKVPTYGYYMMMFVEVASNFFKVSMSFLVLIFGFLIAFMVTFHAQPPFDSIMDAFVKTMVMMTNEFDYSALYDNYETSGFSLVFTNILFLLFLLMVGIVLMNLLVGLTIVDIKQLDRLRKQAQFLSIYEKILFDHWVYKRFPSTFRKQVDPVMMLSIKAGSSVILPNKMRNAVMEKAFENREENIKAMTEDNEEKQLRKNEESMAAAKEEIKNIAATMKLLVMKCDELTKLVQENIVPHSKA